MMPYAKYESGGYIILGDAYQAGSRRFHQQVHNTAISTLCQNAKSSRVSLGAGPGAWAPSATHFQ
jgi:hypothetical protein